MPETIISLKNISMRFDSYEVLKNVSLSVEKGSFLGIIGPNGGGKTTLLRIILGLLKPTKGKVKMPKGTKIGYVPQYLKFDRDFPIDVWDVVSSSKIDVRKPWSFSGLKEKKKIEDILKTLGILDLAQKQIGELSGGQKQRVLIARALAIDPDILILDEPTASVDTPSGKAIYESLEKLNENGMTIILVSHDIGVLSKYVKSIACMNVWLFSHDSKELTGEMIQKAYGCPIDIIAHGHPHRVLGEHENQPHHAK